MTDDDPWRSYVAWTLYLCGAMYLLLGAGFGALGFSDLPLDEVGGPLVFAVYGVVSGGIGLANFVVGWGFDQGYKWAWFAALILGALYAPSICLPFGGVLLYGCLNDRTRKEFLG